MASSGGEEQDVKFRKSEDGNYLEDPCVGGEMLLDSTVEM